MSDLLNGSFAPTTWKIGFVESPADVVAGAYENWKGALPGYSVAASAAPRDATLSDVLRFLEPLTGPISMKTVIVPTRGAWTAVFEGHVNGGDPDSTVGYLAEKIECRGLAVSAVPSAPAPGAGEARLGSVGFSLVGPEETDWLNRVRVVHVIEESTGRWKFVTDGEIQDFEETGAYDARRVVDRLDVGRLAEYCGRLMGIDPFLESSYVPERSELIAMSNPAVRFTKAKTYLELNR